MHIEELKSVIGEANAELFSAICGEREIPPQDESASRRVLIEDQPDFTREELKKSDHCYCGTLRERLVDSQDYSKNIILRDPKTGDVGSVAVGAVIDSNLVGAERADLPIVLAVGINYGQGKWYLSNPVRTFAHTGMRPKMRSVFEHLIDLDNCKSGQLPSEYHLVVANIFPWITSVSWSQLGLNSIEESLFIDCFGGSAASRHLVRIVARLGSHFQAVVFHGANNAVPYFGVQFAARNQRELDGCEIIFCDNLAPGQRQIISNAARLCTAHVTRGKLPVSSFDE